ncbi:hypothetical protein B7R21_06230 [Subtercola boreus]|uniref:Uncharacterized protein n=1 Tax=Subtercola boreus TaxID=120213 RepID=A0A3E0VYH9_9MICO|nr:hypothetical protein [Subtercola boreus]RFA14539.1 hypothetical protein B7R21_06230 [Subtercola boreus]
MSETGQKSPIQRRIAANRVAALGLFGIIVGGLCAVVAVWVYASEDFAPKGLISVGVGAILVAQGIIARLRARELVKKLEQEHGVDAGVQKPR